MKTFHVNHFEWNPHTRVMVFVVNNTLHTYNNIPEILYISLCTALRPDQFLPRERWIGIDEQLRLAQSQHKQLTSGRTIDV